MCQGTQAENSGLSQLTEACFGSAPSAGYSNDREQSICLSGPGPALPLHGIHSFPLDSVSAAHLREVGALLRPVTLGISSDSPVGFVILPQQKLLA